MQSYYFPFSNSPFFSILPPFLPPSLSPSHPAQAQIVITADEGVRGGKVIPLKATVDEAVKECESVKSVFVAARTGAKVPMYDRDIPMEEVCRDNEYTLILFCKLWN